MSCSVLLGSCTVVIVIGMLSEHLYVIALSVP